MKKKLFLLGVLITVQLMFTLTRLQYIMTQLFYPLAFGKEHTQVKSFIIYRKKECLAINVL